MAHGGQTGRPRPPDKGDLPATPDPRSRKYRAASPAASPASAAASPASPRGAKAAPGTPEKADASPPVWPKVGDFNKEGFIRRTSRDRGFEKAAKFLLLLGKEEAARVLKHLTADEVEGITTRIAEIERIDEDEASKILEEFGYLAQSRDLVSRGGLEKAREILHKAFGDAEGETLFLKVAQKTAPHPFAFLMDFDVEQVCSLLHEEPPAVVSVILPHLHPSLAARVLASLPALQQREVARRIAHLDKVNPEVLRQTEEALRRKVRQQGHVVTREIDGREALAQILRQSDASFESRLIDELRSSDHDLAEEIARKVLTIDVVHDLLDRDLQKLLRDTADPDLILVLRGVDETARARLLEGVSSRRKQLLEEEIAVAPPIRRSEADAAIRQLLEAIRAKRERGEITLTGADDEVIR